MRDSSHLNSKSELHLRLYAVILYEHMILNNLGLIVEFIM